MRVQPSIYVLDDKTVAVFSVIKGECKVKMECLLSEQGILDYTLEFSGPIEKRDELTKIALEEAQSIYLNTIIAAK
ncbi:hypothetical protein M4D55_18455 [Metabacillus idriensis]|jgi:hypothetical protein|uniref:Uncharacterized protein n=1 Tax=Metabacillus idriensis TaxID=324768 RepID=A0A6I2MAE8_9BACI|nr:MULTISPECIES: hypothetical protein [Bacillaceae]OHR68956.1 hypothetical protein HMPREF3291_08260 [Bacillus sp. HMSC76G11]MCM3597754.1 hypothetical protein [Metabacillus idriensis]MDR0139975.1 hypothetical protein [Metabacillus idriensis]MRX54749.1 hypothetical protein [Metabacillus idriensis]TDL78622.1 hypothetical protein E2R53_14250 [Peribacillus frigoritolerans]